MVKLDIFAGGGGAFIAWYTFDSVGRNLTHIENDPTGPNATWIEKSVLSPYQYYVVNEIEEGSFQFFVRGSGYNGSLAPHPKTYTTFGSFPKHLLHLPTGHVSVVNTGSITFWPLALQFDEHDEPNTINLPPPCLPYQTVLYKHEPAIRRNELFVPDPGCNTIWRLVRQDSEYIFSIKGEIKQPYWANPRRAAVFNNTLFTLHDYTNTITSQSIPPLGQNTSEIISNLTISIPNVNQSLYPSGDILIPQPNNDFNSTLIYTSIHNDDDRGDSIVIISLQPDGKLVLVNRLFTGLKRIQGMKFGGDNDRYLVAGGSLGGGVIVWERIEYGTQLLHVGIKDGVANHTSFVWAEMSPTTFNQ